jgi:hypothetical protein
MEQRVSLITLGVRDHAAVLGGVEDGSVSLGP